MKKFKPLLFIIHFSLFTIFIGCGSSTQIKIDTRKVCPQCNMPLPKDNKYTAYIEESNYFDDIGCLILWSKANRIDLDSCKVYVFSNDTKRYINALTAYYKINEKTPMNYGFSAYEKSKEGMIEFKEMRLRMLRGEHLGNPKIRKKILGY
jgi:hypothetical protein